EGVRLSGANLSQLDLSGVRLAGAEITGDLSGVRALHGDFSYADLRNTNLSEAVFDSVKLIDTFMPKSLRKIPLDKSNLAYAPLPHADLDDSSMKDVELAHADLRDTRLLRSDFRPSSIAGADLTRAVFEPRPGSSLPVADIPLARGFESLGYDHSPHA